MKLGCAVFVSVRGGVAVWGGVAIIAKSWVGGSIIDIEDVLSCFSILSFLGFGKTLIILEVVVLGASIVGVMIMRVIDLMMIIRFNFFQMLI
jgi:hypothetical protein